MERTLAQKDLGWRRNLSSGFTNRLLNQPDEIFQRHANRATNLPKLEEVQAALSRFILAHIGLWLTQAPGEIRLTQASIEPNLPKDRTETRILPLLLIASHEDRIESLAAYPKMGYGIRCVMLCTYAH